MNTQLTHHAKQPALGLPIITAAVAAVAFHFAIPCAKSRTTAETCRN